MLSLNQKFPSLVKSKTKANGFILLEVLVAMSLVAGSWIGLSNTYQGMVLRLAQLQEKRLELSRRMDRHELAILAATQGNNLNPTSRKLADESFGMSHRSRPFPNPGRTTYQK